MRRLPATALMVFLLVAPVCAQRGSAHGGSSGHAASGFHGGSRGGSGGFIGSTPSRSAPGQRFGPGYAAARPFVAPRGLQRSGPGDVRLRRPYNGAWRYRRPYFSAFGTEQVYGYPAYGVAGFIAPDSLADGDGGGDDGSVQQDAGPAQGPEQVPDQYDQQPNEQSLPPWPYGSAAPAPASEAQPSSAPPTEDAVTLIFKDGRPPEQIHNYILSRNTLYIGDRHRPDIPVDELDLAATVKANRDAGVDFRLPDALR